MFTRHPGAAEKINAFEAIVDPEIGVSKESQMPFRVTNGALAPKVKAPLSPKEKEIYFPNTTLNEINVNNANNLRAIQTNLFQYKSKSSNKTKNNKCKKGNKGCVVMRKAAATRKARKLRKTRKARRN